MKPTKAERTYSLRMMGTDGRQTIAFNHGMDERTWENASMNAIIDFILEKEGYNTPSTDISKPITKEQRQEALQKLPTPDLLNATIGAGAEREVAREMKRDAMISFILDKAFPAQNTKTMTVQERRLNLQRLHISLLVEKAVGFGKKRDVAQKQMTQNELINYIIRKEFPQADEKQGWPKEMVQFWHTAVESQQVGTVACTMCRYNNVERTTVGCLRSKGWKSSGGGNSYCPACVHVYDSTQVKPSSPTKHLQNNDDCRECDDDKWIHTDDPDGNQHVETCHACSDELTDEEAQKKHDKECAPDCPYRHQMPYGFSHGKECIDKVNKVPVTNLGNVIGFQLRKPKTKPQVLVDDMSEPP